MRKRDELTDARSCLSRARDDEWIFSLLGRDRAAPATVRGWIEERIRLGLNRWDDPQIEEAFRWIASANRDRAGRASQVVNVMHAAPTTYKYIGRSRPAFMCRNIPGVAKGFPFSPLANPFSHKSASSSTVRVETAARAVECFEHWICGARWRDFERFDARRIKAINAIIDIEEIIDSGSDLGCWCVDKSGRGDCHGFAILDVIRSGVSRMIRAGMGEIACVVALARYRHQNPGRFE